MNLFRLSITAFLMLSVSASAAFAETARVSTKEAVIRDDCRFLSPVKGRLNYGDELEISSREGDWLKVRSKNIKGCIHKNAVTEKQVELSGTSSKGSSASGDEVALAGKGFNPEVERSYRSKHPELDFRTVDSIEGYGVSDRTLESFISRGGLNLP